ncbi:MAG TPA: NAD(P)H-binding protein [Firmicutes bacterium]|nr:NAD(P)H-binding protein [Candidatus Fermentithermobacillaceae bacterium]
MGTFAFIIHPIELADVSRKFPIARYLPDGLVKWTLRRLPPIVTSRITGVRSSHGAAEGWFISCPLTAEQMVKLPEKYVLDKVIRAARTAEKLGAGIVGLGAFTSVVGDAGITVRKSVGVAVTTGNSYTVATAIDAAREALKLMDRDMRDARVLVLGATGSIGKVLSELLADDGYDITMASRNIRKLEYAARSVLDKTGVAPSITTDVKRVLRSADVVFCVSSSLDVIVEPPDLKPGALVVDVSRPRNVSREVARFRKDVLVIEGGVVRVPGDADFHFDFGFPKGLCYACMAETMVLAMEERYEDFSLGRDLSAARVKEISRLAGKHGFTLAGFRSFERPVSREEIARVVEEARAKTRRRSGC